MTDEPPPVVEIDQVTFSYPHPHAGPPVLDSVSLRVQADDFLGIIGPNGGGKTTLIKLMLGLIKPRRGRVRVLGRSPVSVRSQVGYVPQHAQIDSSLPASVLDMVLLGRLSRSSWGFRFGSTHIRAAMDALAQTGMQDLASRPIGALSGGQLHRVLLSRALAADAKLLLLDEPETGVDIEAQRGLVDLLHHLNQRLPIVMVSHDVSFVSTHLKHVACLNHRLSCHSAYDIPEEVVSRMYHDHVRPVHHNHDCPLVDPGCDDGCTPPASGHPLTSGFGSDADPRTKSSPSLPIDRPQ